MANPVDEWTDFGAVGRHRLSGARSRTLVVTLTGRAAALEEIRRCGHTHFATRPHGRLLLYRYDPTTWKVDGLSQRLAICDPEAERALRAQLTGGSQ